MNIIGFIIGAVIIIGLIAAMGVMSRHGVEINDQFRCGDGCDGCSTDPASCGQFEALKALDPQTEKNSSYKRES